MALSSRRLTASLIAIVVYIQNDNEIDRLLTRDELADGNKSLASVARGAGVEDFALFQNAGYLGMYNMPNWKLARQRNVKAEKLMDHMGRTELAANLFRVTQTEERIKSRKIMGQANLEQTHYQVGKEVRKIIIDNTGKAPEKLSIEKPLTEIKKEIKSGHRKMVKQDASKKK